MEAADSALLDKRQQLETTARRCRLARRCRWDAWAALGVGPDGRFGETQPRLSSFPLGSVQGEAVSGGASPSCGPQGAGLEGAPPGSHRWGSPPSAGRDLAGLWDPAHRGLLKCVCVCGWRKGAGMKKRLKREKQQQQSFISALLLEWRR